MGKVVLFMAMSLDGFIAGPDDTVSQPAGRGGERLFAWSDQDAASKAVHAEYEATGAVLAGRRTYDLVNGWGGDHHDGVGMFILTHEPPAEVSAGAGSYTFVTDGVESAVAQAKAAAGDKDVLLHGADAAQQCLRAGLLDQLVIHLMPVLLGEWPAPIRPPRHGSHRARPARLDQHLRRPRHQAQTHAAPPTQTNGKFERFHRTPTDGWAYARFYRSEAERQAALPGWLHFYNHHRIHSAIAGTSTSRLNNLPGHHN